ncbi:MAG: RNA polymerase sigma factor [Sphingomonadales bacterium]
MKRISLVVSSLEERGKPVDEFQTALVDLLPRLRRFARALARDTAQADDVVQTAVERALRARHQWQRGTRLDSWLYRIVRNTWIDEVRASGRRAKVFAPEADGLVVGSDPLPVLEARIEVGRARQAMQRLPDEQREAIALVLVEGMGYAEAADVLDIPLGTLTSRLLRGRATLARMLAEKKREEL